MSDIKFNLNDKIRFKLTDYGKKVWIAYHAKIKFALNAPREMPSPPTETQLWFFMLVFGPYMIMGAPPVLESNNVTVIIDAPAGEAKGES